MAVTTLGVVWIGLLGSFAALILRWSNVGPAVDNIGTDTLFLIVLGVVANDIGALLVGSAIGKTPLRAWISPDKTVEGLIGGTLLTLARAVRRRPHRSQRHVDDRRPADPRRRDRGHRAARRPHREHVQAQPRREGLRHDRQRPRRRARPLRRLPVRAAGRVLPDAGARALGGDADAAPVTRRHRRVVRLDRHPDARRRPRRGPTRYEVVGARRRLVGRRRWSTRPTSSGRASSPSAIRRGAPRSPPRCRSPRSSTTSPTSSRSPTSSSTASSASPACR